MSTSSRRPRTLRRILRWPFRKKRWLWMLGALLVLPWCWIKLFTPDPGDVRLAPAVGAEWTVAVVVRSHHTSIVIEVPTVWALGQPENPSPRFAEYGWGDRRFYKDSNFWPHALFAAAFLPSASVAYVRSHDRPPADAYSKYEVYEREVDTPTLRTLVTALEQSFDRPGGSRAAPYPSVPEYSGRFFPGRESYIFWSSCNTWTVDRLADAGLASSSLGVVLASQVSGRLEGFTAR